MQAPVPRKLTPRNASLHHTTSVAAPLRASSNGNNGVAAGPTVLLEDSQVFIPSSQTATGSQSTGYYRTPRVRTILTAEAEDEAIQLTSEGKITTKNAWNIKLLEGIHDSVSNALSAGATNDADGDSTQFTKCANLVEGGAKIWTQRVEHTAAWSHQVLRRLHRSDGNADDEEATDTSGTQGNGDGTDGGGDASQAAAKRAKKRERTVAECLSEINLDSKQKAQAILQNAAVSAQFRAITERFEQGNAQGLLLNNAPMGSLGNLIIDVDYSRVGAGRDSKQHDDAYHDHVENLGHGSPSRTRLSTALLAQEVLSPHRQTPHKNEDDGDDNGVEIPELELDDGNEADVHLDPPNQRPSWGSMSDTSLAAGGGKKQSAKDMRLSSRVDMSGELFVPNVSQQIITTKPEAQGTDGSPDDGIGETEGSGSPIRNSQQLDAAGGWGGDDDDDGGGGGDDYGDYEDDDGFGSNNANSTRSQSVRSGFSRAASSARDLVSGVAELAFFDRALGGGEQLALAADDPNTWFPMSQADSDGIRGAANGRSSFIQQLRRATMLQSQQQQRGASSSQANPAGDAAPRKKARTEKQQVVAMGDSIDEFLAPSETLTLVASENKIMNPRRENLKRNIEEFRERYQFRRSLEMARENNIALPDVDTKGVLPWWIPSTTNDVTVYFQPFSTSSVSWNVLNKRVTAGEDGAARLNTALSARQSTRLGPSGGGSGHDDLIPGDIPVHMFDDDECGGDDGGAFDDADDDDDVVYAPAFDTANPFTTMQSSDDVGGRISDMPHFSAAASDANGLHHLELMERPEITNVLKTNHATVATQVDVVRLRRVMWQQTQRVLMEAPTAVMVPNANEDESLASRFNRVKTSKPLKRGRGGDDDVSETDNNNAENYHAVPLHRFSEVVAGVLPHVNTISTTGTLSPAFLFFSLLFLANEHGILLENIQGDVQDVYIAGLVGATASSVSATA